MNLLLCIYIYYFQFAHLLIIWITMRVENIKCNFRKIARTIYFLKQCLFLPIKFDFENLILKKIYNIYRRIV